MDRITPLLVIVTVIHPCLGRDPVPFVCTKGTNPEGTLSGLFSLPTTEESVGGPSTDEVEMETSQQSLASRELTRGYIFTFLSVDCDTGLTTQIFIGTKSCGVGASGNITFPLNDGINQMNFYLEPGGGNFFDIPSTAVPSEADLNQTVDTSIVVDSDEEVVVYGHQRCNGSNNHRATAFGVKSVEDLGNDYWVITHQKYDGKSQVGVVATSNDTNIIINGRFINKNLSLNKYETYYFGGTYDLTGTHIVADNPVLVIAGNSADKAPNSKETDDRDSFYKCLPPTKDWGRKFTLVPFPNATEPFTVKVLSSHDYCLVEYSNDTHNNNVSLSKGNITQFESSGNVSINSSKGILVAQFSRGQSNHGNTGNPSMMLTPPYGIAGKKEFVFPAFNLYASTGAVMSIITVWLPPEGIKSDLKIDNTTVQWDTRAENIEGYRIVSTNVTSNSSHILQSGTNITAVVNGLGKHKFYSYNLQ